MRTTSLLVTATLLSACIKMDLGPVGSPTQPVPAIPETYVTPLQQAVKNCKKNPPWMHAKQPWGSLRSQSSN